MSILQINASIRGADSASSALASEIVARLHDANPTCAIQLLDVGASPLPLLDNGFLGAHFAPVGQRSSAQQALVDRTDQAIAQVQAADFVVIGVPMYNFAVPAQLKGWFDAVARAGVTFQYTENGPQGLLTGKKVYLALARGGIYAANEDPQLPWLMRMLAFIGLTDVTAVRAEGLAMGQAVSIAAMQSAREQISALQL
ncbi:MAG: NAD(P)H-dependent oxidoreductase [Proteobacteria bacterium]|nr:NAD(P)H-dependent oxidoreductase [Pseudomonadota bacterium]